MLPRNIKDLVIQIDKGHTVVGGGCVGAKRLLDESYENRQVGDRLIAKLKSMGATVIDVSCDRASNSSTQLNTIVSNSKKNPGHLLLSLHLNAGGGTGAEIFTTANSGATDSAKQMINTYCSELGLRNRGHKTANFAVLKNTSIPAMLLELIFVDNDADKAKWDSLSYDQIIDAIIKGLGYEATTAPVEPEKPSTPDSNILYRVVVGTYGDRANADAMISKLEGDGYPAFPVAYIKDDKTLLRVIAGTYGERSNADKAMEELNSKGYSAFIAVYNQGNSASVQEPSKPVAPPEPPKPARRKTCLSVSSYSSWGERLQRELRNQGFKDSSGRNISVDGYVGDKTYQAASKVLIKNGTRGDITKLTQEMLSSLGYDLSVDGIAGNGTENAIRQYQADWGLGVDGAFGPKCWAAMLNR